jgi:hypothetical protein
MLLPKRGEVKKVKMSPLFEQRLRKEIESFEQRIGACGREIKNYSDEIHMLHQEIQMRKYYLNEANTVIEEPHGPYV